MKNELTYANLLIKELSARSGVGIRAIHSYLRENGSVPSAEAAVNIARALGVSVEYLVTGTETRRGGTGERPVSSPISRSITRIMDNLSEKNQQFVLALVKAIKQYEDEEK